MKLDLTRGSLLLLGFSIVAWVLLTLFESTLVGISLMVERGITFLLLVLPSALGAVLGAVSLRRHAGQAWLAAIGVVLNSLFAVFHLAILAFAG